LSGFEHHLPGCVRASRDRMSKCFSMRKKKKEQKKKKLEFFDGEKG